MSNQQCLMSKHTKEAILSTHHAKHLVRVICDIFYYFSWFFNYMFISETLTNYLICKKKRLSWEPTPMELYKETHIKKGDRGKGEKSYL